MHVFFCVRFGSVLVVPIVLQHDFFHTSWFYITAGTHVCGYRFGFSKGVPWTLNAFCMNIFALMPFGQTQV